jgi:hypothetical protein
MGGVNRAPKGRGTACGALESCLDARSQVVEHPRSVEPLCARKSRGTQGGPDGVEPQEFASE